MIVKYPDFPPVDGRIALPRPSVVLLGSYHPQRGAHGGWYRRAALRLVTRCGAVFYGVKAGGFDPGFVEWLFFWFERVDAVVVWIGDASTFSEFEVGWCLGGGAKRVYAGSAVPFLRQAIGLVPSKVRHGPVHEDLDSLLSTVLRDCRGSK